MCKTKDKMWRAGGPPSDAAGGFLLKVFPVRLCGKVEKKERGMREGMLT